MSATVTITIRNWDKYNPKRDQKNYTWLRLSNDLATCPELFGLSPAEKFIWVCLLCEASKKNSGEFTLNVRWLSHTIGAPESVIIEVLGFLFAANLIECDLDSLHDKARSPVVANTTPTYERKTRHETDVRTGNADTDTTEVCRLMPDKPASPSSVPTWEAYRDAYQKRYGTAPVRNARINSQLKQFVSRIGAEEAPLVAEFYLNHNLAYYVRSGHAVGPMLQDAEKLRTEWATGQKITGTTARQLEKSDYHADQLRKIASGEL